MPALTLFRLRSRILKRSIKQPRLLPDSRVRLREGSTVTTSPSQSEGAAEVMMVKLERRVSRQESGEDNAEE
jgi:hypothetical protein